MNVCKYCGGEADGVHRIIERKDGACVPCAGGDVMALARLLVECIQDDEGLYELGMKAMSSADDSEEETNAIRSADDLIERCWAAIDKLDTEGLIP